MKTQILNYLKNNKKKVILVVVLLALFVASLLGFAILGNAEITFEHLILVWMVIMAVELSEVNKNLEKIANK